MRSAPSLLLLTLLLTLLRSESLLLSARAARRAAAGRRSSCRACTWEAIRPAPPSGRHSAEDELRVTIQDAGEKGMGAFANQSAPPNTWVCTYQGELVTLLDTAQRYTDRDPAYLFQITPDLYRDAEDSTHFSRYFNHHQNGTLNFTVNVAEQRIDFFTACAVAPGEELTFDYGVGYWAG